MDVTLRFRMQNGSWKMRVSKSHQRLAGCVAITSQARGATGWTFALQKPVQHALESWSYRPATNCLVILASEGRGFLIEVALEKDAIGPDEEGLVGLRPGSAGEL